MRVPAAAAGSAQLAGELLSNETAISVSRHCRGESCRRRPCYAKESGQRGIQSKINTRTRARGELVEPPPQLGAACACVWKSMCCIVRELPAKINH